MAGTQQVVAGIAALLVTMALTFPDPFTLVAAGLIGTVVALHPARSEVLALRGSFSPPLVVLATVIGAPLTLWAWGQAALERNAPAGDLHAAMADWAGMAAAGLALTFVAFLAAKRTRDGARLPAWTVGIGLALLGVASLVFPDQASSFGAGLGAVAIVAGVTFTAVAEHDRRRTLA